ncbi:MAG: DAK2 domain-containing protein [Rubrobacteridae bacterium]|nr:DAK2 domain-containing protein [Rubrobacteridae bacterium]
MESSNVSNMGDLNIRNKPGRIILLTLKSALVAIRNQEETINKLNVYPVPDGDTGTNMVLTLQNVISEASNEIDRSMYTLMSAITYGSLVGARGNSGVILSQIMRGMCEELGKSNLLNAKVFSRALKNGSAAAYSSVKKPVEGTMLTVIKDMATATESFADDNNDMVAFFEHIVASGKKSVENTPNLLPVLKEAGVVDAGGYGLLVIMQGILSALKGERIRNSSNEERMNFRITHDNIKYAYCTELILKSDGIDLNELESRLDLLGDSMLLVGTNELTKVHIHTNQPGEVLNIATSLGQISEVAVNNIVEQSKTRSQTIAAESAFTDTQNPMAGKTGVIAVANGIGIKKILQSLGVDRVVYGGQSMNPSTGDIMKALNDIPHRNIIILPNNSNIILAAQQVVELSDKNVSILPTKSVLEAFSAMTVFSGETTLDDNILTMTESISSIKTGEVTTAVRAHTNGSFKENDFIGLHNHVIKATSPFFIETSLALIKSMIEEDDEVITVLMGELVTNDELKTFTEQITELYPDHSIEIHRGDQPIYHMLVGIE